jgi:hypothetical protein
MALIDRLAHDAGVVSIHNHRFSAAVWFWSKGDVTRQNVIDAFGLDSTDQVQLDLLRDHYLSLSAEEKLSYHSDLEAAGILLESGLITKIKYASLLGLT